MVKLMVIICLLLVLCGGNTISASFANSKRTGQSRDKARHSKKSPDKLSQISRTRYVVGGILGTTLGFGLGHGVQRRWQDDYGWLFTVGSLATLTGVFKNLMVGCPDTTTVYNLHGNEYDSCETQREKRMQQWLVGFLSLKVVETVSVWWPRNVSSRSSDSTKTAKKYLIPITHERYRLGGILGTTLGFGLGHAMQRRWSRDGWPHTLLQGSIALIMANTLIFCRNSDADVCLTLGFAAVTGTITLPFVKVLEALSVWSPSPDRYRITANQDVLPISIMPLLSNKHAGVQLLVAL